MLHPELPWLLVEALDVPNSPESVLVVGPLEGQTFGTKNTSKRGQLTKLFWLITLALKNRKWCDDMFWTKGLGDMICINAWFKKNNSIFIIFIPYVFPQLCQIHQCFLQIFTPKTNRSQTFCQTSTSHPRNLIILGYPYHTTFIPMFLPFWFRTNGPNQIWGLVGESQSSAACLVVWYHPSIL